mmetsp:Transcript_47142/g.57052  ORF Transcript_47142/g.57052 Transcript_47142/m.57052 type:complete len:367 (-) Transcript_47142:796-1896(-)|eukprot:CAMPEP_0172517544 /NCGR_PEP_ID=MMETSP1066-20121228/285980_1 /TAXON_ID=671091 /ORGANISM="Coscinodiscus wailesii, Strain CCMP2513" /LENGTH=366 /DNA_ID=CAMNT_0013299601 /DNA_START=110 /DNA_END=1210 /DNA_ORIENTATION=-
MINTARQTKQSPKRSLTTRQGHQTASLTHQSLPSIATLMIAIVYTLLMVSLHTSAYTTDHSSNSSQGTSGSDNFIGSDDGVALTLLLRLRAGPDSITVLDLTLFGVIILLGLELLNFLVKFAGYSGLTGPKRIPVRGKHLDELSNTDLLFIGLNKVATPPFVYFLFRYMYFEPNSVWDIKKASVMNVIVPLPVIFVMYDFFYTLLHCALHVKGVYAYIHKHHHHQKAPSRANVDAVNVHPIEFFLGEYNHLFAVFLYCRALNQQLHILSVLLFLVIGGALASINHTRFDITWSVFGIPLYDSKNHDVHHRIPQSNYGQYIMFWDYVFGSYRPYNKDDRVNPVSQLDPKTGKSLEYLQSKGLTDKFK